MRDETRRYDTRASMQLKEGNSYVNLYQFMRSRSLPNDIGIANINACRNKRFASRSINRRKNAQFSEEIQRMCHASF